MQGTGKTGKGALSVDTATAGAHLSKPLRRLLCPLHYHICIVGRHSQPAPRCCALHMSRCVGVVPAKVAPPSPPSLSLLSRVPLGGTFFASWWVCRHQEKKAPRGGCNGSIGEVGCPFGPGVVFVPAAVLFPPCNCRGTCPCLAYAPPSCPVAGMSSESDEDGNHDGPALHVKTPVGLPVEEEEEEEEEEEGE